MKKFQKKLFYSFVLITGMTAQAQVVKFPMEIASDGTTKELISNQSYTVNGALSPVSMDGAKGKAWRLDGYSSYLKAKIDPTKIEGQSQLTFSLWVAPESYPMMRIDEDGEWFTTMAGNLQISENNVGVSGDKGFAFQLGSRGTYQFVAYSNKFPVKCVAKEVLPRYQWNHLVVTFDGTSKKIVMYNNGVEVASVKTQKTINGGNADFYVGKSYQDIKSGLFYLNTFNGLIDDFEVYSGIRSDIINEKPEHAPVFAYSPKRYANDILRPAFHGMPSAGWTNETHGAVYYKGKYHVFFQKNPNGPYMARLNWGHIESDNLYKWEEVKTAISPEKAYDLKGCWSGCVFTDDELTAGKPNIFYTGVDYGHAMISQAQPEDDDLLSWTKNDNNPIVNGRPDGLSDDFRDCYVFKNEGKYYMIVGTSKNGIGATTLHRYDKSTKTWSNDGSMFFSGSSASQDGTFWEMPNITKIGDKWLFTTTPQNTSTGVRTLYWTGTINADGTFNPDSKTPKNMEMTGFSKEGYGLLSPTIFQKDGKTLLLGIVPDKLPSEENYYMGYAHTYSLPREITLDANGNLVQKPFEGLAGLRSQTAFSKSNFPLSGTQDLSPVEGRCLELSGVFVAGNNDFGFTFLGNGSKKVTLTCSPSAGTLELDLSGISRIEQDGVFGGKYKTTLPAGIASGKEMKLTVYVDHSIVDVFVNDTYAASVRVFPRDIDGIQATAFCNGEMTVKTLQAYVLDVNQIPTAINLVKNDKVEAKVYAGEGKVNYELNQEGGRLSVYDIAGRCVASESHLGKVGNLKVAGHGVHVVRLQDEKQMLVGIYKIVL